MKCRVCKGPAVIGLRRHNANFCGEHLSEFCVRQLEKAIHSFKMIDPDDKVLVAVSGGKDSLALWHMLAQAGYNVDGLYIGLGIGGYSDASAGFARDFASAHSLKLVEVDLSSRYGFDVPSGSKAARRTPCSACGLSKRHVFDRVAVEGGYDVLATGHNLDDEAAVLFGNVLTWQIDYLARQHPVLPARPGYPKKVKPLMRLDEREMAAYCVVNGIDYIVEECPMSKGNKHLGYKSALNEVEATSPGTKATFFHQFLNRAHDHFASSDEAQVDLGECASCGSPTPNEVCAFCSLVKRASALPTGADLSVSVKLGSRP